MTDETLAIPTIEEIMRFRDLSSKVLCNAETLPESEIDELDRLERKTQGYDLFGILHDSYESQKARADANKERADKLKAENARMRLALEGLTNAALAQLKPLDSQVDAAFEALKGGE